MENKKLEKMIIIVTAVFVVAGFLIMFGGNLLSGLSSRSRKDVTVMPEATGMTDEIRKGIVVEQNFICNTSFIDEIGIVFTKDSVVAGAVIAIELVENNRVIVSETYSVSSIQDQHRTFLKPEKTLTSVNGKEYTLRIYSASDSDTGVRILYSSESDSTFRFNGKTTKGTLCFSVSE